MVAARDLASTLVFGVFVVAIAAANGEDAMNLEKALELGFCVDSSVVAVVVVALASVMMVVSAAAISVGETTTSSPSFGFSSS